MDDAIIIRDARVLAEDFIPSRIIHRDGQLKAVRDNLAPLLDSKPARHSFLHGPPGTGKTCLSRYVTEELKKEAPVTVAYVNCWEHGSRFTILYELCRQAGAALSVHRKGTPTDETLEVLRQRTRAKSMVAILDEVDRLEDFGVLYDLLLAGVSLILVSNKETALHTADPRVRSRLSSLDNIPFPAYTQTDIREILADRAAWGLAPAAIRGAQLDAIARKAEGDARVAINILCRAAEDAERAGLERITDDILATAAPSTTKPAIQTLLQKLTPHQRELLKLIESKKRVAGGPLFKEFAAVCDQHNLTPVSDRTFRNHMEVLVRYGLVAAEGEGRWKLYAPVRIR